MTKKYLQDRLHGQGLPSSFSSQSLARIARKLSGAKRYANVVQVMADGYEPTEEPNRYRKAHAIWALCPAEEGEGYVLIRQREERAPDLLARGASRKAEQDSYSPPESARNNAKRGLEYRKENGGKGGTEVGLSTARLLSSGKNLSRDKVSQMHRFFSRHEKNKKVEDGKNPKEDAGYVAWLLWGGDSAASWAADIMDSKAAAAADSDLEYEKSMAELAREADDNLWDNIRKKRERGEPAAKPGDEDYPDADAWEKAQAYKLGQRVAFVHNGELTDATIILLSPDGDLADLVTDTDPEEHVTDIPVQHLHESPCAEIDNEDTIIMAVPLPGGSGTDPFRP